MSILVYLTWNQLRITLSQCSKTAETAAAVGPVLIVFPLSLLEDLLCMVIKD